MRSRGERVGVGHHCRDAGEEGVKLKGSLGSDQRKNGLSPQKKKKLRPRDPEELVWRPVTRHLFSRPVLWTAHSPEARESGRRLSQ